MTAAPKPEGEGAPETEVPGQWRHERGEDKREDKGTKRATSTWRARHVACSERTAITAHSEHAKGQEHSGSEPERHRAERTSDTAQRHRVRGKTASRVQHDYQGSSPRQPRSARVSGSQQPKSAKARRLSQRQRRRSHRGRLHTRLVLRPHQREARVRRVLSEEGAGPAMFRRDSEQVRQQRVLPGVPREGTLQSASTVLGGGGGIHRGRRRSLRGSAATRCTCGG